MALRGSSGNNNSDDNTNDRQHAPAEKNAAKKHRLDTCLTPLQSAVAIAKSSHSVRRMIRNNTIRFFKHNLVGSLMSELEACAWSFYYIHSPKWVPAKANAHKNIYNDYVGISVQEIPNFRSIKCDALNEKDLANKEIVKNIANILVLSYLNQEDDLHINNFSKYGCRIDFDMSFWPIFSYFKKGALLDWFYRTSDPERFRITEKDIDNFPDLEDAQPFYWPTIPQRIVNGKIITLSHNAYPADQIALFKKLKNDPDFIRQKFKSMLKYLLIDTDYYALLAREHIRNDLRHPDPQMKFRLIVDIMANHVDARKKELHGVLVKMKSFQDFLWKDGPEVIEEIKQEFQEYNEQLRIQETKKWTKHPERSGLHLNAKLIDIEKVEKCTYNEIFLEAKENALAAPRI